MTALLCSSRLSGQDSQTNLNSRMQMEITEEKVELRHVLRFPLATWLNFAICFFFYIGILTFYAVARCAMSPLTVVRVSCVRVGVAAWFFSCVG